MATPSSSDEVVTLYPPAAGDGTVLATSLADRLTRYRIAMEIARSAIHLGHYDVAAAILDDALEPGAMPRGIR